MAKFIFVTGGVTSSLGKGIIAASLANSYRQEDLGQQFKNLILISMLIPVRLILTNMVNVM
jgi:F0F1-type ATP synthase membrane subunit c/vacuolar-type H+-ATPase subunit K